MASLLLFRRALSSPTMCRFIPALSVHETPRNPRRCEPGAISTVSEWAAAPENLTALGLINTEVLDVSPLKDLKNLQIAGP
jgi:hypothetical protein